MLMERVKYLTYTSEVSNLYFWRTYSQQEIDLVEERGRRLDVVKDLSSSELYGDHA